MAPRGRTPKKAANTPPDPAAAEADDGAAGAGVAPAMLPVGPAPTWVMAVGAGAGLLTLAGLFVFAFLASTNANFVCYAFPLLAPIFAFGAGLTAAFMGGAAAVTGHLGLQAQKNAMAFSAGGGIAVFLIAFVLFHQFQPPNCGQAEAILQLNGIPQGAEVTAGGLWQQRQDSAAHGTFDVKFLVRRGYNQVRVALRPDDGSESCNFYVEIVDDLKQVTSLRRVFDTDDTSGADTEIKLEYARRTSANSLKASDPSCFTIDAQPLVGYIAVSPNGGGAIYGVSVKAQRGSDDPAAGDPDESEFDVLPAAGLPLNLLGIGLAIAQSPVADFESLQAQLVNPDPNVRVSARQYLSQHFALYIDRIVAEILDPAPPPVNAKGGDDVAGDYVGNLLSALIAGIDAATEGRLAPGQKRDLSQTLPFIGGHEQRIVELTADPDAAVRKQARRLIQRFPVDAFESVYAPLLEQAAEGDCAIGTDPDSGQAIIYSAVFFGYNRIVQKTFAPVLNEMEAADAEDIARRTLAAAACLVPDLRVDSALVYFGLATLYREVGNPGAERVQYNALAKDRARSFLETVAANGGAGAYYFQSHVTAMRDLAG